MIGLRTQFDPQLAKVKLNRELVQSEYERMLFTQCRGQGRRLPVERLTQIASFMAQKNVFEAQKKAVGEASTFEAGSFMNFALDPDWLEEGEEFKQEESTTTVTKLSKRVTTWIEQTYLFKYKVTTKVVIVDKRVVKRAEDASGTN